ncbi:MAG: putative transporter permease protein [Symbiobacteriaceae bacterium]|nr:putative transporter permease protein [Symbiobacteriaceae bacterium]
MEILRNLYRRRTRAGLTILGIAVGILAFTVMGGMAEKINLIIRGSEAYFSRRIAVRSMGGTLRLNLLMGDDIAALAKVPGVQWVETHIMLPMDETAGFELAPRFLVGVDLANFLKAQSMAGNGGRLSLRRGAWWSPGAKNVAVLGAAVARKMKLNVGDTLTARDTSFKVVGILDETLTMPDGWAFVPQDDARRLMMADSKILKELNISSFVTNAYALVAPEEGDTVTDRIASSMRRGFLLYSPQQLSKAAGQASTLLTTAIMGAGAVAVIVGALSVINTMLIAVAERTREIGIKKAIGATRGDILREFLAEATVMGLFGGLLGVGLGAVVIYVINWYTADQGTPVFVLTARLALWAIGFSGFLGAAAGLLPAWRAAGLDPVDALREL